MKWLKVWAGRSLVGEVETDGAKVGATDPRLSFAVRWNIDRFREHCIAQGWTVSEKPMSNETAQRIDARRNEAFERDSIDFSSVVARSPWRKRRK